VAAMDESYQPKTAGRKLSVFLTFRPTIGLVNRFIPEFRNTQ
jgi:hypothetical protein